MHPFKKIIILLIVFSLVSIHFPKIGLAAHNSFTRTAKAKSITKNPPKYLKSPEEEIPLIPRENGSSYKKWLWTGLSVVAAGVLAGALGGGGGGGGSEPLPESKTDIEVQWE